MEVTCSSFTKIGYSKRHSFHRQDKSTPRGCRFKTCHSTAMAAPSTSEAPNVGQAQAGMGALNLNTPDATPQQSAKQSSTGSDTSRPSFYETEFARRPPPGDIGNPVAVRANFFLLNLSQIPAEVFTYSIAFPQINNRDPKNTNVKRHLLDLALKTPFFQTNIQYLSTDYHRKPRQALVQSVSHSTRQERALGGDPGFQANIALKVNAKLGGVNHIMSTQVRIS